MRDAIDAVVPKIFRVIAEMENRPQVHEVLRVCPLAERITDDGLCLMGQST
ncbi:hypothetical protein ACTVZO_19815 [Streptomyces sp. IBSNAI002]|uniref:hypothetical protein n=1 Tax=Streptomyces sp. IBSNAI002 TaxID=3457500 RepID=UPI003FCFB944